MDLVVILIIIVAVTMIAWIIMVCGEIEQIKRWVRGIERSKEDKKVLSQSSPHMKFKFAIGDAQADSLFMRINNVPTQVKPQRCKNMFIGPDLWGIPDLKPEKVYYLCHPCTTGGKTIEENKAKEEDLYRKIIKRNPGAKVIRPLVLIPDGMKHGKAMRKCLKFIDAADGIILPSGWSESRGCTIECKKAVKRKKEIMYLRTE